MCQPVDASSVYNKIENFRYSGGNTLINSGGMVIVGESKSSIQVYTEINGEVVEDVSEEVEEGELFQYEKSISKDNVLVDTKIQISTQEMENGAGLLESYIDTELDEYMEFETVPAKSMDTLQNIEEPINNNHEISFVENVRQKIYLVLRNVWKKFTNK